MEKFDICFINLSLKPGGGNRVILELFHRLVSDNYKCRIINIIYSYSNGFSKTSGLKSNLLFSFIKRKSYLATFANLFLTLSHLLVYRKSYQLIIVNNPIIAPLFAFLKFNNIYYFIQADDYAIFDDKFLIRNTFMLKVYKLITKTITYNFYANRYLFNSAYSFEKFSKVSKQNILNPTFVLPGVDLTIFSSISNPNLVDGSNSESIVIATILRKNPWKGSEDYLRAVKSILEKPDIDSNNYRFLGITNEDISNLPIFEDIEILEPRNDNELSTYLNQSHIFVVTSWWEGFGLPGLEAMACGCFLITTRNGGCDEYAVNRKNCMMYEPRNVQQLISLILEVSNDKNLRKEIAKYGVETAQKHSWGHSTSELLKLFSEKI